MAGRRRSEAARRATGPRRRSGGNSERAREEARPVQIGRWRDVSTVVRALAETAPPTQEAVSALSRLATGLAAPLRQLDELAELAARSTAGDERSRCDLRARLGAIVALAPQLRGVSERAFAAARDCAPPEGEDEDEDAPVLDQGALASLVLATAQAHGRDPVEARDDAIDAVVGLSLAAARLAGLAQAFRHNGHEGLIGRLEDLSSLGKLEWAAAGPMHVLSGPAPAGFGGPGGLPGLPPGGLPGLPPGGIGGVRDPELIPGLKPFVDDLISSLRGKRRFDPEIWDHAYPWWRDPIEQIDRFEIDRIRCAIALARLLKQRSEPPPARPARVVWSDGISNVTQRGVCAGDQIVIRGKGFGDTKPPNVTVILPRATGCRPVDVPPRDWSDTQITVTLPPDVVSGPVGFVDTAYVAAYDAWATRQNDLADAIRGLKCARDRVIPLVPLFSECPPSTAINRIRAGAPIITSFTANMQTLTVVEPTDTVTLAWTVLNAEQIRVDRVSPTGPTFAGSTSLVDPPMTVYPFGQARHAGPGVFVYRLTATGPCGTAARDVTVVGSRRPRLRVGGVEVTQSVQTTTSSVRLVERKPTVVRVTVRHGLAGWGADVVPNVTGRIRVRRGATRSPWFDPANNSTPMAATPGASITVVANPQRNNTNDTLNFLIPPAWCTDTVSFEVEVRVTGFGAVGPFAGFNGSGSLATGAFSFERRRTLELRYIRVNWGGNTPTHQVCLDTLRSAIPLLPTPTANIAALGGVGVQNPGGTATSDRDDLIEEFDDRHNCSWWEALWEWLGEDCPDDDGAIWVLIPGVFFRGRAYDIPSNVCFTPPSDGPYAAHELAHCLDQTHVGLMCANGQQAQGGDAASAWPNNASLVDVPFDVTRNRALTLAGTGVFDVMTYCGTPNNTWPLPERWQRLWDRIGS